MFTTHSLERWFLKIIVFYSLTNHKTRSYTVGWWGSTFWILFNAAWNSTVKSVSFSLSLRLFRSDSFVQTLSFSLVRSDVLYAQTVRYSISHSPCHAKIEYVLQAIIIQTSGKCRSAYNPLIVFIVYNGMKRWRFTNIPNHYRTVLLNDKHFTKWAADWQKFQGFDSFRQLGIANQAASTWLRLSYSILNLDRTFWKLQLGVCHSPNQQIQVRTWQDWNNMTLAKTRNTIFYNKQNNDKVFWTSGVV